MSLPEIDHNDRLEQRAILLVQLVKEGLPHSVIANQIAMIVETGRDLLGAELVNAAIANKAAMSEDGQTNKSSGAIQ